MSETFRPESNSEDQILEQLESIKKDVNKIRRILCLFANFQTGYITKETFHKQAGLIEAEK